MKPVPTVDRTCHWCRIPSATGREVRQQNIDSGLAYLRFICPGCERRVFGHIPEGVVAQGAGGNRYYRERRV